jgi:hypothetical protein
MWTGIIDSNPSKMEEKLNGMEAIEEALGKLDNEQDAQEVLDFIIKKVNDRKNYRRTIQLVNTIKNCAKELAEISPELAFFVLTEDGDCWDGTGEVEVNFEELYDALNEMSIY